MKLPIRRKKPLIFLAAISVIAALSIGGYLFMTQKNNTTTQKDSAPTQKTDTEKDPNAKPPTEEEQKAGEQEKNNAIQENEHPTASITITATNSDASFFRVRTLINTVTTGNCHLTMTASGRTVTKDVSIQPMATSSTCAGFDIHRSELPSGKWQLTIEAKTPAGTIKTSREVTV